MKKSILVLISGILLGLLWSCGGTKSAEDIALNSLQYEDLKELVTTKQFTINMHAAYPFQTLAVTQVTNALLRNTGNTGGRISLTENSNFIKVSGQTVQAELAYFGERQMGNTLDPSNVGISFDAEPSDYKIIESKKKQVLNLEFDVRESSERYKVFIELYPSKRANVTINSASRTSIRYVGKIKFVIPEVTALE